MSGLMDDNADTAPDAAPETQTSATIAASSDASGEYKSTPQDEALVSQILKTIKSDKAFHKSVIGPDGRMHKDMFLATHGCEETWSETSYTANIIGRHVKQKTAALYAKNPRIKAKRQETMDFAIWDENPDSLKLAFQTIQAGMEAQAEAAAKDAQQPTVDAVTGVPIPTVAQLPPGFKEAQDLIADYQQGLARRQQITKLGTTLQILFARVMRNQKPLDFKTAMKQLVRRASTTGVGYVELGFQREMGPRPGLTEQLADARQRLDHLASLAQELAEGEIDDTSAEAAELQASVASLQTEQDIILREGLIFDFPQSTKVIPDKLTRSLVGFVGARHLTIEYLFTEDEVKELFPEAQIGDGYVGYNPDGSNGQDDKENSANKVSEENPEADKDKKGKGLICVWKYYDKPSGLVYYVADGHKCFLRKPAAPDVFVTDFWPVYALTFNAVENEKKLFPPSDAYLLLHMQTEYNRARQGLREHRKAARPRWAGRAGMLDDEDIETFKKLEPFEVALLKLDPQVKLENALEVVPVPGVDPNLYETNQLFTDIQLVGGAQEAQYGATSASTATQAAIAANSSASSDGSSIDDLDGFLSSLARGGGQILLGNMSKEQVMAQVGPGAVWPDQTPDQIADEVYLDIEAGSSGNPNQAVEIDNWNKMLPFLIQMPDISHFWLAKETIRRLDDDADLVEAMSEGVPSVVAQNTMTAQPPAPPHAGPPPAGRPQPHTGDASTNPGSQGPAGAAHVPMTVKPVGSAAPMGNNQM